MEIVKSILSHLKWSFALSIILGMIKATLSIVLISYIGNFSETGFADKPNVYTYLFGLIILTFAVGAFANVSVVKLSTEIAYSLRRYLAEKVLKASYAQVERIGDAKIKVILNNDTTVVTSIFGMLPDMVFSSCFIVFSLGYLVYLDLYLFMVLIVSMGIGLAIISALVKTMHYYGKLTRDIQDDYQHCVESLSLGMKEMALNNKRRSFFYQHLLNPILKRYRFLEARWNNFGYIAENFAETVIMSSLGVMILFSFEYHQASLVVLADFALIVIFIRAPIGAVVTLLPQVNRARVALDKMKRLTDFEEYNNIEDQKHPPLGQPFTLELQDVKFQYQAVDDSLPFQIGPVNLQCKSGELIFIIGGNGSGKSTLLKLISGLYMPTQGQVSLADIASAKEHYRDKFSAIFSDYYLMRYVIDEKGGAVSQDTAKQMLKDLHLQHKVTINDGQFSDISLSQGQKKRLALLISKFENKNVVIFDEWAADQDPHFKEVFYQQILPELKAQGKLVIVVSHDENYFAGADRIFKLVEGNMTELSIDDINHEFIKEQFKQSYHQMRDKNEDNN